MTADRQINMTNPAKIICGTITVCFCIALFMSLQDRAERNKRDVEWGI